MIAKFCLVHGRPTPVGRAARLLLGLAALAATLFVSPTSALAKGKTVAVVAEGPDADAVRRDIAAAVPRGTPIADAGAFKEALVAEGIRGPFGKALDGGARDRTVSHVRKAAAATGVDGTLIALVSRTHKERHVRLLLIATSGPSGDLEDEVVLGAKPSKDDKDKLASSVGTALVDYRSASGSAEKETPPAKAAHADESHAASEPDNAAPSASDNQPAPDTGSSSGERPHGIMGHDLIEIAGGAGAMGRHFGYSVNATSSLNLRPYTLFPAAAASVDAELYPLADSGSPVRDIGFVGSYSTSLFLKSTLDGNSINTTATSYLGGLRWRAMPSGEGGFQLGISATYAVQAFAFGTLNGATPPDLPSVNYQAIRPGADLRIPIGKLSIFAQAGFRALLSAGDVALRFHGTTTTGFDFGGGAAFLLTPGWELRVVGDYAAYFYSFSPLYNANANTGDLYRATGAADYIYGGHIALAGIF